MAFATCARPLNPPGEGFASTTTSRRVAGQSASRRARSTSFASSRALEERLRARTVRASPARRPPHRRAWTSRRPTARRDRRRAALARVLRDAASPGPASAMRASETVASVPTLADPRGGRLRRGCRDPARDACGDRRRRKAGCRRAHPRSSAVSPFETFDRCALDRHVDRDLERIRHRHRLVVLALRRRSARASPSARGS